MGEFYLVGKVPGEGLLPMGLIMDHGQFDQLYNWLKAYFPSKVGLFEVEKKPSKLRRYIGFFIL